MIAMISSSRMMISSSPSRPDFAARVLAEQDVVASLDIQRAHIAVLQQLAAADRDHGAARGLLGLRQQNDATLSSWFLPRLPFEQHAVMQGPNVHR